MSSATAPAAVRTPSTRWLVACAILYIVLTLAFLGDRPISRAQEARVLETARQMLASHDWHAWLVPQLNGEARLRKPPLCYWYTAAAFNLFGVNEFVGRLPTLILGWLTIGATYLFGRDLLGRRAGFFGAAVLASSYFFVRFARSAETDTPAMLGTVIACWAIVRAGRGSIAWFHVAALGIALSLMTKGGPAVYPVVFIAIVSALSRSWKPFVRFIVSGAPLLVAALALPWFLYIFRDPASAQVAQEMKVVTTGSNHFGLFYQYIPIVVLALLPWSGVFVAALFAKEVRTLRPIPGITTLPTSATILAAIACVALPLCVTLNVQPHYLLPMLPACALLVAWLFEAVLVGSVSPPTAKVVRIVFAVTCMIGLVAGPATLAAAYVVRHRVDVLDVVAAVALVGASVVMFALRRRPSSDQAIAWATCMIIVMPIVAGWWAPRLNGERSREIAAVVRATVGDHPLATYGDDVDISLNFALRRATPLLHDEAEVLAFVRQSPNGVILFTPSKRSPVPAVFGRFDRIAEIPDDAGKLQLYTLPQGR